MRRRQFVKILASLPVAAWATPGQARSPRRIAVIGGGILGASIAWHLVSRGAEVTVLEKNRPASGATAKSFAWLNAHYRKMPQHYHQLSWLSCLAWRVLDHEFEGRLGLQGGGALQWQQNSKSAAWLSRQVQILQRRGYPCHLIEIDELKRLEPEIISGPVLAAAHADLDGSIDPKRAAELLLAEAGAAGARLIFPAEVTGLTSTSHGSRRLQTTAGEFEADAVVIAGGVGTPRLAAMAGIDVRLKHSSGLLAFTRPQPKLLSRVVVTPAGTIKQMRDGRIVVDETGGVPTSAAHDMVRTGALDFPDESLRKVHGQRILDSASKFLPAISAADLERVSLGWPPMPVDGYPIMGFADCCPDIYIAVTHSGMTLAPLLGQLAALEILDGVAVEMLSPYRASRFS